jgi:hypothetical protein
MSTSHPAFPTDTVEGNAGFFLLARYALSPGMRSPMTVTQDLEVTALHPPIAVQLRLLLLLFGVLVSGMAVGFFCLSSLKPSRQI